MNPLTRYEPLSNQIDTLFNEFFRPAFVWDNRGEAPRTIRVDVKETADSYSVHAELPGVKKEDISVEIDGNEVLLSAEAKRTQEKKEGEKWLRSECFYGKTERRFALPHEIDEAKAQAKFQDGILELTLPKKAAAAGRKLNVQ